MNRCHVLRTYLHQLVPEDSNRKLLLLTGASGIPKGKKRNEQRYLEIVQGLADAGWHALFELI